MDVLQYCGHVLSYLEKMRFIEHCHSLMAGIEQRMGADDEDLIWLKQNFEQVKGKLDLSRASPELGREVSITSGEAVSSENEDDGLADDEQDGPGVDEMDNTDEGERKNSGDDEKDESGQVELNECGDDEMGETEEDSDKTTDTEEDAMDEIEDEADDPGQAVMPIAQTTQYGETGPWEGFND